MESSFGERGQEEGMTAIRHAIIFGHLCTSDVRKPLTATMREYLTVVHYVEF
jgi:hypothetical protein